MKRSVEHCVKTGEQSADNPYTFIMSTEAEDRMGDIIRQDGWDLKDFNKNPIALFGHSHSFPIGSWKNVRVEGKKLIGDLVLAAKGTSERIDEIRSLVEQRILKAVSVGFRIKKYSPMDPDDPWGAWDILESSLMETSVVSVPANQEALLQAKALGISRETRALVFAKAGQTATPNPSQDLLSTVTERDYSDLLGASSDSLRPLRRLG